MNTGFVYLLGPYVSASIGTISQINFNVYTGSSVGQYCTLGLYYYNASTPNYKLLGTCPQITLAVGNNVGTLGSPTLVTAGVNYWFGVSLNSSLSKPAGVTGTSTPFYSKSYVYSAGVLPATVASPTTSSQATIEIYSTVAGSVIKGAAVHLSGYRNRRGALQFLSNTTLRRSDLESSIPQRQTAIDKQLNDD